MASLQKIKTRINSAKSTRKITKAMQLVASAKLKTTQKNLSNIQEYYSSVQSIFSDMLSQIKNISEVLPKAKTEDTLWIIITSDMGLCGAYNSNVIKMAHASILKSDKVIVIGSRGLSSINHLDNEIVQSHINTGDNPNFNIASIIGDEAIASYMTGMYKSIKLIHTKFINSFTQEATITKLLPLEKKEDVEVKKIEADFEPSVKDVLKNSIPLYFNAMVYGTMLESKVSEMSSRRVAMENATDNADELIDKLNIEYNRARQAAITQEINEIVAGSE